MPFPANPLLVARNVLNNLVVLSTLFGAVQHFLASDAIEQFSFQFRFGFSFSAKSATQQLHELGLGFTVARNVVNNGVVLSTLFGAVPGILANDAREHFSS